MQIIQYIPIEDLHPHPDNPRKDLGDLTELAESIKAKGVLQNLTVVPDGYGYRIIIGHRRYAAAKLAGIEILPCSIADMTPQEQFETMMVENVQRSDLTVYEQAEGFQTMLDMGGSVEEVAAKTGFSASTVRNRVKLLQLDKKKFKQGEKRGATLQDYLKIATITDPELRNKVLTSIATPNFDNELKNAQKEEEFRAYMEGVMQNIKAADWLREKTEEDSCTYGGDYSYYTSYDKWHQEKPFTRPDDADTVEYIYAISTVGVTLYRKKPDEEKADPEKEKLEQLKKEIEAIKEELEDISLVHLEMREEFIQNFTAFNNAEMDIAAFATKAFMYCTNPEFIQPPEIDYDRLGNLIGVKIGGDYALEKEGLNRELFNRPQYVLLCTAYTSLEGSGNKYFVTRWNKVVGTRPEHQKNTALDIIYEGLKHLGYEMSDEEIQMQNGKHPLFAKAERLIDEYEIDIKEGD